jgi:hypothetical protein
MQILVAIFLIMLSPLSATYILINNGKELEKEQKSQIFNLILKAEPPCSFYQSAQIDLNLECKKLLPSLSLKWIPPTLWQLGALHAFFFDPEVRNGVLACSGKKWEPLCYDEMLHSNLVSAHNIEEIILGFDHETRSLPNICELFFKVNQAVASLYKRGHGSDAEIMHLAISEIPPFNEWLQRQFPFWNCPWIYNPNSIQLSYIALKDASLLSDLLKIERIAHENGEWVLYRGYDGLGYPSTLQIEGDGNHALSFGSTLLGGIFFSLEASALAYCKSDTPILHSFLALRITPQELRKIFRVGPLHPFIQMLVDGEMFHTHTKVAVSNPDEYKDKSLNGYFMKCNKHCIDPVGYMLSLEMTPEDLDKAFRILCEKSGHIFLDHLAEYRPSIFSQISIVKNDLAGYNLVINSQISQPPL